MKYFFVLDGDAVQSSCKVLDTNADEPAWEDMEVLL